MAAHDDLLDAVGDTPLVRLRRVTDSAAALWVKLEYLNPGGSVKDRAALAMVLAAERAGTLGPGSTIVEASSGNTGIGLAQVAAVRGYRMVVVLPETIEAEKLNTLRAYGAEVVLTPPALPREHPDHVERLAARTAAAIPGGWLADQYGNPANPAVHRVTTGPEIWRDTAGAVTHLVASIGTGGTITGTGSYLREVSGGRVTVIGADPLTSRYAGGDGSPFAVAATGRYRHPDTVADTWPAVYDPAVVDRIEAVPDGESIAAMRALARREGLLVGPSSGAVTAAALRVGRELGPDAVVVAILPDSGRAYLSIHHSPTWRRRAGFLEPGSGAELDGVVPVPTVGTRTTAAAARERLAGAPLLLVVVDRASDVPAAASEVLGALRPAQLADLPAEAAVGPPAGPPLPTAGVGEPPADVLARLDEAGADHAVVLRDNRVAGVVSRAALSRGGRGPATTPSLP